MSMETESYTTLAEASRALGRDGRYLGGGTLLMRDVNYGAQDIRRLLLTADPALKRINAAGNRVEIGAATTMAEIIASRDLAFLAPVARQVGGPAIRRMATVGGNLFAAHPYGDLAAALLALDGVARMADGREAPLDQLFADRGRGGQSGLVMSVSVMKPREGEFRWRKVTRVKPKGASVLAIAAWLPGAPAQVRNARVVFGAMGPTPLRARAVERALEGARLDQAGIARALSVATEGLEPQDDALASAWYRREVAPVHLRRLLLEEGN